MNSFVGAVRIQRRVVWALMLRETKTMFGKHKLGYLWALINACFHIGIFWAIRSIGGFTPPPGMSTPVFLLGGFVPWLTFTGIITGLMNGVSGNRALLAYPQVFPVDVFWARGLLQSALNICVLTGLLVILPFIGHPVSYYDPESILLSLVLILLLGFGLGSITSAFNLMWPTTALLVPMILRVLFFTSGLFFSVEHAPLEVQRILFYNPVSHLIELLRYGLSDGYTSRFVSLPYVAGFTLVAVFFGLLLEKYSRRYLHEGT